MMNELESNPGLADGFEEYGVLPSGQSKNGVYSKVSKRICYDLRDCHGDLPPVSTKPGRSRKDIPALVDERSRRRDPL